MGKCKMYKWGSLCLMAGLLLSGPRLRADVVTVGSADTTNCLPFGCAAANSVSEYQQVYLASSFVSALPFNIAAVSFFKTLDPTPDLLTSGTYTISFSTTAKSVGGLDSTLDQNVGFDMRVFFSGTLGGAIGTELTIGGNGATPTFNYDPGAGNLLMDIKVSGASADTHILFNADDVSSTMSRAAFGLSDPVDIGLVTKFSTIAPPSPPPPPPPVPEPGTVLLLGTGLLSIARVARGK
jgi:hypothetical protein